MSEAGYGQMDPTDVAHPFNAQTFMIESIMARMNTAKPVVVVGVSGGGVGQPPTLSVQPMVNQIDGEGFNSPHGIIHGIPVARLQGGKSAIINDPKVGDRGIMICADRDISSVKTNRDVSGPGSFRRHDAADGMFVPCLFGDQPEQYVFFTDDGIVILDKTGNKVTFDPAGMTLADAFGNVVAMANGSMTITPGAGTLTVNGSIVATGGISSNGGMHTMAGHVHSGVDPGAGDSGPPVPE